MNDYAVAERLPTVAEYLRLREACGWSKLSPEAIETGLKNSLYSVCIIFQGEVIGYGRVVGDSGVYFYVQDILVMPEFQLKGIGKLIMNNVMKYIKTQAPAGAFIGLMATAGNAGFYEQFGFVKRDIDKPGMVQIL